MSPITLGFHGKGKYWIEPQELNTDITSVSVIPFSDHHIHISFRNEGRICYEIRMSEKAAKKLADSIKELLPL